MPRLVNRAVILEKFKDGYGSWLTFSMLPVHLTVSGTETTKEGVHWGTEKFSFSVQEFFQPVSSVFQCSLILGFEGKENYAMESSDLC